MIGEALLDGIMIVEASLLALAVLLFMLHGIWLHVRTRRRRAMRTVGRARLARLLAPHGVATLDDVNALRALPPRVLVPLFTELGKNLAGEQKVALRELARTLGLVDLARRRTQRRRWRERLRGARFLAQIGEPDPLVLSLLRDPHAAVRAQAAEWAGSDPTPAVIERMLELLADPATLSRFAVQDALLRMGEPVVVPLAEYLVLHEGPAALAGLRVAAATGDRRFLQIALHYSYDMAPDGATAATSAELLSAIGGAEVSQRLLEMLEHPAERAQLAAIRGLGRMRHWPATSRLAAMLDHPRWKVRHAAALALRTIGAPGVLHLRRARSEGSTERSEIASLVLDLPEAVR